MIQDGAWTSLTVLTAFDKFMKHKIVDLDLHTPYRFQIAAENEFGRGPYAETDTVILTGELGLYDGRLALYCVHKENKNEGAVLIKLFESEIYFDLRHLFSHCMSKMYKIWHICSLKACSNSR